MNIKDKPAIKLAIERLQALLDGKTLQLKSIDRWDELDGTNISNLDWLVDKSCRIKPEKKTIPLSLETWPPGLVMVRLKGCGNLVGVGEVSKDGVCLYGSKLGFIALAANYTHPDGRPLTIEVEW